MTNLVQTQDITKKFTESLVLVHMVTSRYGTEKTDKAETKKVKDAHNIKSPHKTYKVKKDTLPIKDSIEDVRKHDTNVLWATLKRYGVRYSEGTYMIPAAKYLDFTAEMRRHLAERATKVARVGDSYNIMREAAKITLGTGYIPDEYPPVETVLAAFKVTLETMPIADPSQLRLSVVDEAAEAIQQAVNETFQEKTANLSPYLKEILLKPLNALSSGLQRNLANPKTSRLSDSLFENVHEAADQVKHLNILGDDQLTNSVYQIEQTLPRHAGGIKDNPQRHQQTLEDCNTVIESLDCVAPVVTLQPCDPAPKVEISSPPYIPSPMIPTDEEKMESYHNDILDEEARSLADSNTDILARLGW